MDAEKQAYEDKLQVRGIEQLLGPFYRLHMGQLQSPSCRYGALRRSCV